jgi:hypothetical protein
MNDAWEDVASPSTGDYLERIEVPGGWIYRQVYKDHNMRVIATALVFVPAPEPAQMAPGQMARSPVFTVSAPAP